MAENNRFDLVFVKLNEALQTEPKIKQGEVRIVIKDSNEVSSVELDEINNLRQIVLESTEPQQISFTTT